MLCYAILYYTIQQYTILYNNLLYCTMLYCTKRYYSYDDAEPQGPLFNPCVNAMVARS